MTAAGPLNRPNGVAILGRMSTATRTVGDHLREWRQRRRMSQLELACEADISARHLSFLETGRSTPSREMILHLAARLQVPARARNILLLAAGYAPIFPERSLDDPALSAARNAINLVLEAQRPYPAFAIDRHWQIVESNRALPELYVGVAPALLEPPVNVLRLTLHPDGMAPRVVNLAEWRAHLLGRLEQQIVLTADPVLADLLEEASRFPAPRGEIHATEDAGAVVVPFQIRIDAGTLSFFSTTTVFGTPVDVTLSELAIEAFFPADAETTRIVQRLAGA